MKTVRFLPVAALLAMLCVASVSAVDLYDVDGYYFAPVNNAATQYTFTVQRGDAPGQGIKEVGYYVLNLDAASAAITPEMLKHFDGTPVTLQPNQVLGIWARHGNGNSENYAYSTEAGTGNVKFVLEGGSSFVMNVMQDNGNGKITWIVGGTAAPAEITPPDEGGSGQTTGAPLPAALATLLLMGGVGGSLSLRKRRRS